MLLDSQKLRSLGARTLPLEALSGGNFALSTSAEGDELRMPSAAAAMRQLCAARRAYLQDKVGVMQNRQGGGAGGGVSRAGAHASGESCCSVPWELALQSAESRGSAAAMPCTDLRRGVVLPRLAGELGVV